MTTETENHHEERPSLGSTDSADVTRRLINAGFDLNQAKEVYCLFNEYRQSTELKFDLKFAKFRILILVFLGAAYLSLIGFDFIKLLN